VQKPVESAAPAVVATAAALSRRGLATGEGETSSTHAGKSAGQRMNGAGAGGMAALHSCAHSGSLVRSELRAGRRLRKGVVGLFRGRTMTKSSAGRACPRPPICCQLTSCL